MHQLSPLLLAAALGACTVGPDFTPPDAATPAGYNEVARTPDGAATMRTRPDPLWWNSFNDPQLTSLVSRALIGNLSLQQAVLRIAQSRQGEAAARAAGLPTLSGDAAYTRQQLGLRGILESAGVYDQVGGLRGNTRLENVQTGLSDRAADAIGNALGTATRPTNLFQQGLDASWELDIFGRVARQVEQANARTQSAVEGANDSLVSLMAEVVRSYASLRGAQALAQAQGENVDAARDILQLTERRQRQGLTSQLDVENQRAQLTSYQAQLQPYAAQMQQAMNRLSVLTGQPPGVLDAELATSRPIPVAPPVVPVGVPSDLARRRPDIRRAEADLHTATASVGVAVAQFYPTVSLTGSLGTRAVDASYLFDWASHFYSAGPAISVPIFQGGRLKAGLRLAKAQEAEAALGYRATVLNALAEVEDALVAYRTDQAQAGLLQQTVGSARTALSLSRERYEHGLASFIEVLDAQRTLVQARQQEVRASITVTNDVVALYKALGGGWSEGEWLDRAAVAQPQ